MPPQTDDSTAVPFLFQETGSVVIGYGAPLAARYLSYSRLRDPEAVSQTTHPWTESKHGGIFIQG